MSFKTLALYIIYFLNVLAPYLGSNAEFEIKDLEHPVF